jgi:hypothetical protein
MAGVWSELCDSFPKSKSTRLKLSLDGVRIDGMRLLLVLNQALRRAWERMFKGR